MVIVFGMISQVIDLNTYIYQLLLMTINLVLGIPHPAVSTRDVALYVPFRNALRLPNQNIGLQTLTWQLMSRRIQDGHQNPVSDLHVTHENIYRLTWWSDSLRMPALPWIYIALTLSNGKQPFRKEVGPLHYRPAPFQGVTFDLNMATLSFFDNRTSIFISRSERYSCPVVFRFLLALQLVS